MLLVLKRIYFSSAPGPGADLAGQVLARGFLPATDTLSLKLINFFHSVACQVFKYTKFVKETFLYSFKSAP